jgi:hypothetical protein
MDETPNKLTEIDMLRLRLVGTELELAAERLRRTETQANLVKQDIRDRYTIGEKDRLEEDGTIVRG